MEKQNNLNIKQDRDQLFEQEFEAVKSFAFDQQVADVFADMIQRSVPGYDAILKSIAMFSMQYAQDKSNIYDLGCSLGAVAITAAQATKNTDCQIIAVDTSEAMINKCREIVNAQQLGDKISVIQEDIIDTQLSDASIVISNFTLQFIPKELRRDILHKIYKGLNAGGVFILSEKFKANQVDDEFLIEHYHAYKKINGYSNKEIQRKRQALKNVLVPDTDEEIQVRLRSVGFKKIIRWFQCFNFASYIAVKE